jgi:hypothetical protein
MTAQQRPSSWYASWMIGTSQAPATTRRNAIARELLQAIKDHDYDSQSLEEVILLIDHEYLCRKLEDSEESKDKFKSTIRVPVIGDFADHLSSCLVTLVYPSSYSERELQCRALLSVLALLQLHGVRAQQTDSQAKWQGQLNRRFQELVWLPAEPAAFSAEIFHKAQCAYLLSLGAAYTQTFIKAEPKSTAGVAVAVDVMQLGVVAVATALV